MKSSFRLLDQKRQKTPTCRPNTLTHTGGGAGRHLRNMNRNDAVEILDELKNSPNMVNHAKACGYSMAALFDYFEKAGKKPELDKDSWEIVGLLHDADYEATDKSLEKHTDLTCEKLKEIKAGQLIIDAIRGHCDKEKRKTLIAKSIYAVDELTGLIVACALVQPDKKLTTVTVKSVLKKFKDKSFAAGANRDQIKTCETEFSIPLNSFMGVVLNSIKELSKTLNL